MFHRKLRALGFPRSNEFNPSNEVEFRKLVVWLEDQKIRHYKIEDRAKLKNIQLETWSSVCNDYLKAICCPFTERLSLTDWLLGYAIRLEYGDNAKQYQDMTGTKVASQRESKQTSSISNIDENNPQFKTGVRNLAKVLNIPLHEDDKITLCAVLLLVEERVSEVGIKHMENKTATKVVPLEQQELGFDTKDKTLNNAARALRLLHINELRQLQTDINNAIVSVQTLTANPKTDQRLGKVGRG
ncbi:RNA transcription, translation and transport factor protein-like [Clavelina lepadiformis]|uniref:RNA transcription, translation and transport factor protein-like n=1 Tax=Clavelina lepadiformis TaxID=159417 RepID=UPI004042E20F